MRFPKLKDGEAFRTFIREVTPTIMLGQSPITGGITFVFGEMSLDQIMYNHLRCNLLHEGEMPQEVQFTENAEIFSGMPVRIPDFWVLSLAKAVADAPENAAACGGLFR